MKEIRTKLGEGGRVIIPMTFRQNLHLSPGDDLILHIEDNEIHITTPEQALFKLQSKVKSNIDKKDKPFSLVEELLSLRRSEAKYE